MSISAKYLIIGLGIVVAGGCAFYWMFVSNSRPTFAGGYKESKIFNAGKGAVVTP